MNSLKALVLLTIGAILGYGLSSWTAQSHQEDLTYPAVRLIETPTILKAPQQQETRDQQEQTLVVAQAQAQVTNNQTVTLAVDDEALTQQYLDLRAEHQQLKDKYKKSKRKVSSLKYQLSEFDGSVATDEEMEKLAPEPFNLFLSAFRGKTRNDIYDFHRKEDDLDWGYNMQNNISDFVQTHYDGMNIDLISVICKQPYCEILVTEKQEDAWNNIIKGLLTQPWWKFSSTNSSSNNVSIYMFLTQ
ncbi:hypothetical protein [Colwellia hornerae]|uniref:Uncharacterized protein n=1 Tax=Colwellia hornerae TaxID=89402 RepID=A0A5C6QNG8_9GAMM|nr:hypothetical protein [Colwellia hornerae]TWX54600.1 hypothetical protein ESZ28_07730 [Colwellia hornerae]TWX61040.1 hypothetical protein ESZ26_06505 [Colwellia hornerae]TWX70293.1 hypothetical protein ESZ27_03995 [Colwellia hornerae]